MFRLKGTVLLCALLLARFAAAAERTPSHQTLRTQCLLHAADPANAWALAHGITGIGRDFAAADGRRAADVIIADFVKKSSDPKATTYSFDRFDAKGRPVEPHTNLHAKTLVLAGFPLSTSFKTPSGPMKLQDLVDGIKRGFRHVPKSDDYWRDAAWTLDLLSAVSKPGASFKNGEGETIAMNTVMDDALAALERHDGDLLSAMAKGEAQVPKRKQGIYSHHCGGLHLVQAVMSWARFPEVRKRWGARLDKQVAVLFWRIGSEQPQYDAMYQQTLSMPQAELKVAVLNQMVKFHGHLLETLGRIKQDKVHSFTAEEKILVNKAKAYLDFAVTQLQHHKVYDDLESLKTRQYQLYLDLVGDGCHATHGLDLWL